VCQPPGLEIGDCVATAKRSRVLNGSMGRTITTPAVDECSDKCNHRVVAIEIRSRIGDFVNGSQLLVLQ
jgi:hypothetical protein